MIRLAATLCLALVLSLGVPLVTVAQDGTPASGAGGLEVGTPVAWIGNEGTELAKVTVLEAADPFQDYDPSSPPDRGFHFVLLSVSVENTGTQPVSVDPSAFSVVDGDGFVSRSTNVYRPTEDREANPDLPYGEVAAGSNVTGFIGFELLNGTEVERIIFRPENSRLITLVDQRTGSTPVGSTVTVLGTEGTEVGQVTVEAVTDPFQDYDPGAPPQRGSRFVVVEVTLANTGTRPLTVYPNAFFLVDTEGFVATQASLYRTDSTNPPDFQGGEIAPGASVSGIIGYQVLAGTVITQILYSPDSSQQLIAGEPAAEGNGQPQPTPSTIEPPDEPTAEPTTSTTANGDNCAGLQEWFGPTFARLMSVQAVLTPIGQALQNPGTTPPDTAAIRTAATRLATMAQEQTAAAFPPAAEELNAALATTIQRYSDALNDVADALDAKDDVALTAIAAEIVAINASLDSGGAVDLLLQQFAEVCPEITGLLGG